jgi:DNA-binding IclR family transcriptional regulator
MSQTKRDPDAQMKWEADVQRQLLAPCASLGKALLAETPTLIRAPRRQFKPKEMSLETLHEPLHVLGE